MIKMLEAGINKLKKRIQEYPQYVRDIVEVTQKKVAMKLIRIFHDGIMYNEFGLTPLKPRTVAKKEREGHEYPMSPLYGLGDEAEKKSYSNMMRIRKRRFTYYVGVGKGLKHWSGVSMEMLFQVHEYGRIIVNGFGKGIMIRIPPRPAFRIAHQFLLVDKANGEYRERIRKDLVKFIRTGNDKKLHEYVKKDADWEKYDET